MSFIVAGLSITIPTFLMTMAIDSYFYGYLTCPQLNFVWVNVVEKISSYFGEMPWYAYNNDFINEFCENQDLGLKAFVYLSVR